MTRTPFELRVLGPTELHGPDAGAAEAMSKQTKRLALLAYLAITSADGFRRRDQVAAVFWPESDQGTARTHLRKALHGIRDTLGEDLFLTRADDEVRTAPDLLSCDAVALRRAVAEERWSDALALHRGELLEGVFPEGVDHEFHEWLSAERKRLREMAASAAWHCAAAEEARGDRIAATAMARRARELDPDNEEGVRRLLELLDRRGDRGTALRVYEEWRARLQEEFGVEPAPETRKLARRIQAARQGESHDTPALPPAALTMADRPHPTAAAPRARADAPSPATRWPRRVAAIGAIGVLVVAASLALTSARAPHPRSLEFQPLAGIGDSSAVTLAALVTELLTTGLASDSNVEVWTAAALTRSSLEAQSSRRPRVRYVSDGAVHVRGARVVLTLRILLAPDGLTAFAREYSVEGTTDSEIADDLAARARRDILAYLQETRP